MKLPLKSKRLLLVSKILCYVFAVFLGITVIAGTILNENSGAINSFFGIKTQMRVDETDDPNLTEEEKAALEAERKKNATYYPTGFETADDVIAAGHKMGERIVAEGSVLLKNDNNALPLGRNATVSLFSASSTYPAISGTGSGGNDKSKPGNEKFREGFTNAGLKVNDSLYDWYVANTQYARVGTGSGTNLWWSINDASWAQIETNAKTNKADAAVFVLARMGGEGLDLDVTTGDKSDMTDGDYLALSPNELDVLKHLKEEKSKGTFKKIIVIMNSAYQVCGFDNPDIEIDAILWTGSIGDTGTNAIGDLLAGNTNPSGRLTETFWTKHSYNPSAVNFGKFTYVGGSGSTINKNYVVYQEGIYMGYRYTETRYEDVVTARSGAGNFDYYTAVDYPYGYGLSYTNFTYSNFKYTYDKVKDIYTVSVTVKNTGNVAGKEVVQIYLQKPYTPYDIENHIEKASVELVGYGKTQILEPNATETLKIEVKGRDFASYDAYNEGTYVLDAGKYYLTAAKDAHDAVNNVLRAKGVGTDKFSAKGNTTLGSAELVKTLEFGFDKVKYSKSANGTEIVNRFSDVDILTFEPNSDNAKNLKYISRNDWEGTMPQTGVTLTRTALMNKAYDRSQAKELSRDGEETEYPVYSADNGLQLINLRMSYDKDGNPVEEIPYDDEAWDEFLDQLTWQETAQLVANGFRFTEGIERLGKPKTLDHNGSCGVKWWNEGAKNGIPTRLVPDDHEYVTNKLTVNYPCNSTASSTYNYDLLVEYGNQWGEEGLWAGYSGLYGPGANLYRNAYNGRNFEYYGEDPYSSGLSVAAMSVGMSKRGVYIYLKHCVLNDQESNRHGVNTWANEQTIREVYLKAFQIAIEDGGVEGVMTGFNALGATWTSAQGFCKYVLHGEFGMTGIAISDYWQSYMNMPMAVLGGGDLPDGTPGASVFDKYKRNYAQVAWAMRESAHHILYTVVHSNAMNGVTSSTRYIKITPAWVTAVEAVKITVAALFALSALFLVYELVAKYLPDRSKQENGTEQEIN